MALTVDLIIRILHGQTGLASPDIKVVESMTPEQVEVLERVSDRCAQCEEALREFLVQRDKFHMERKYGKVEKIAKALLGG